MCVTLTSSGEAGAARGLMVMVGESMSETEPQHGSWGDSDFSVARRGKHTVCSYQMTNMSLVLLQNLLCEITE